MAERSSEHIPRLEFSRGRLAVGILIVVVVGAGAAWGIGRLRSGPDPGRVIYASEAGVFIRELATGSRKRAATLPSDTLDAWPDPTGRWLAYLRRGGALWMLELDSDSRWQISERSTSGAGWMPDGRFVAAELTGDRDVVAVDPGDRGRDLLLNGFAGAPLWLDRERFVSAQATDMVLVDLGEKRPSVTTLVGRAWPLAVAVGAEQVLYTLPEQLRLVIGDIEGARLGPRRTVFRGLVYRAGVSIQGFVAFSGRERSNAGGTWVLESRPRPPRRVEHEQAESLAFSRDGASLLYVIDGTLYARDLREDRRVRLSAAGDYVRAFAVVP